MSRRRQLGFMALLVGVGLLLWYWSLRSPSTVVSATSRDAKGTEPLSLDDVAPIGLDRLARMDADNETEEAADDAAARVEEQHAASARAAQARSAAEAAAVPTVPPALVEPTPPPMSVRFIGAVEVRSGVWVASLLTDHKDLLTGKEGDVIGNRYRIVKIGIQSIDLLETASGRQRRVQLGGS